MSRIWLILLLTVSLIFAGDVISYESESNIANPTVFTVGMANPATVYCLELGYETTDNECIFPNGENCEQWDFLEGKCGQDYTYCKKMGYDVEVSEDGENPFSQEYAVCVPDSTGSVSEEVPVTDLIKLKEKVVADGLYNEDEVVLAESKSDKNPSASKSKKVEGVEEPQLSDVPSTFDWRNVGGTNWLTPVKNQGQCGSCWAFSAVGAVEAVYKINGSGDLNLSEENLVSDCSDAGSCTGGWPDYALKYVQETGITDENCFPYDSNTCSIHSNGSCNMDACTYDCANSICSDKCSDWQDRSYFVRTYGRVSSTNIKQRLVEEGPLSVALRMSGYWDGDIYKCSTDSPATHAVVLVGYNDSGEYWIAKNSWGSSWNGDGYFKIGYGECSIEDYVYYATLKQEYCSAIPYESYYDHIIEVELNDGLKSSGSTEYSDFTNFTLTTLNIGTNYILHVTGHSVYDDLDYVKAWIDFNQDMRFSEDEEIDLGDATFSGNHTFSANFTVPIPNDATIGETRMRVYLLYYAEPEPCYSGDYGEVEDYAVNITGLPIITVGIQDGHIFSNYEQVIINVSTKNRKNNLKESAWIKYNLNNSRNVTACENCSTTRINLTGINDSIYNIMIFAEDHFNNENKTDRLFYVDNCDSSWVFSDNSTCTINDALMTPYVDENSCVLFQWDTVPAPNVTGTCNYCAPNWTSEESSCYPNDTYSTAWTDSTDCCNTTNLDSDCNAPFNTSNSCDYCIPNWIAEHGECSENDSWIMYYIDSNNCYNQTNLSSDVEDRPDNYTESLTCDYDGDGFIGDIDNIDTTLNISVETQNSTILFKDGNETLIELGANVTINFGNLTIKKQSNTSTEGSLIISGLNLSEGETKTVYLDRINTNANIICIKDAEITNISEISSGCDGANEYEITDFNGNLQFSKYRIILSGNRYKITGLQHSGIIESYVAPPTPPEPPVGGGGGRGGGGGGGVPFTQPTNVTESEVNETGEQLPVEIQQEGTVEGNVTGIQEQPGGFISPITGAMVGFYKQIEDKVAYIIISVLAVITLILYKKILKLFRVVLRVIFLRKLKGRKKEN
ncbi:DUF333 domain-containing protein [bacterium]|nr:DUF333 domain-containing protein [bacterium]